MENVFIVFEGDAWLSLSSLSIMGVFTSFDAAVEATVNNHEIPHSELLEDWEDGVSWEEVKEEALDNLRESLWRIKQIQGYSVGYIIQEIALNEWR